MELYLFNPHTTPARQVDGILPHFADEETEAPRGKVTCPRSESGESMAELADVCFIREKKPGLLHSQPSAFSTPLWICQTNLHQWTLCLQFLLEGIIGGPGFLRPFPSVSSLAPGILFFAFTFYHFGQTLSYHNLQNSTIVLKKKKKSFIYCFIYPVMLICVIYIML